MEKHSSSRDFDLASLSRRERAVVDGAVEGYTDEQIAQSLAISTATVNSYWARIRAKLGPFSRTEIATQYLRQEMAERCAALEAEIATLRAREAAVRKGSAKAEATLEVGGHEGWRFLVMAHLPEASMVVSIEGPILYANPHARHFLRAARHELEGTPLWALTFTEDGSDCEQGLRAFFANEEVRRTVAGLNKAYYVRRRDGAAVRVTISAEWFESPEGIIAAVLLREYAPEEARLGRTLDPPVVFL